MKTSNLKQTNLNEILFPVEKVENERNANPEYAYVIRGTIDGQEIDLNYCSNRYELVENDEIFPVIRQILIMHGIEFTENYYHLNFARFYGEFVIEDSRFAYQIPGSNGDIVKPMLRVQHSYNGLTKYLISFGYFRWVCSNGLAIPVEDMKQYNMFVTGKHTESIKRSLELLNQTVTYFAENAEQITLAITANYNALADKSIKNIDNRVKEVLNASKISIKDNNKFSTMDYIKSVVNNEIDLFGGVANDWLIYNAVNQYINDDSLNVKTPEVRQELDSKVLTYMLS